MTALVLPLLSGALLAFSLPPYDLEWLAWVAVAPLFVAARGRRPLEAVGIGMLAGLVCGLIHVGWSPGAPGLQFAYLPFLWLAMLLGGVTAGAEAARRRWDGARWALSVAGLGVAAEWVTTFSPLPLNLAFCQYRSLALIQIAAVTGIWGVSFLLWWVNAALAEAWWRLAPSPGPSPKIGGGVAEGRGGGLAWPTPPIAWLSSRSPLGLPLLSLALTLAYGSLSLARLPIRDTPRLRVAAIQDHPAGETALFEPAAAETVVEVDREERTRRAAARGARLVVWSEGCLGAAFTPDDPEDTTAALARELRAHLVVGYTEAARPRPFNCAAIVAPDGRVKGVHRKLYPFLGERQSVQPGRAATAFDTALGRMGLEICFNSCYTSVTRRIARAGARLIAMPNYDPPTRHGVLHRLHAAVLPFRAVENRVPFVRADPNGLSQIVDASGRILGQSPLDSADTLMADVALGDGRGTLFTRFGDLFAYVCLVGLVVSARGARRSQVAIRDTSSAAAASG
jgi:apolipoprotein N-acyltransferase